MLGFLYNVNNASSRTTTGILKGTGSINVFGIDTCLCMQILNIPIVHNNNSTSQATFKIPLNNAVKNTIFFNNTTYHQVIYFNNSNYILDKLHIVLYDRTGANLLGYSEWTVSFIVEYDDIIKMKKNIKF